MHSVTSTPTEQSRVLPPRDTCQGDTQCNGPVTLSIITVETLKTSGCILSMFTCPCCSACPTRKRVSPCQLAASCSINIKLYWHNKLCGESRNYLATGWCIRTVRCTSHSKCSSLFRLPVLMKTVTARQTSATRLPLHVLCVHSERLHSPSTLDKF